MSVLVRSGSNDKKSKVSEYDLSFTRDLFEAITLDIYYDVK